MGRLDNRVALVTGASRGIGRAIAITFASEGADVAVNYTSSEDKAREVVEEITKRGRRAIMVKADVSDKEQVKKMVDETIQKLGKIDILVNNAGVLYRGGFMELDDKAFEHMLDVNVKGVINCTREVAKHMIQRRYGKIINISSIAGLGTAITGTTHYAVTKSAVIMLTKRFALELGEYGINVNGIAPGLILTDMVTSWRDETGLERLVKEVSQKTILGRVGKPEDIANVALFLASDESSFITAQVITVDGGRKDFLTHSI